MELRFVHVRYIEGGAVMVLVDNESREVIVPLTKSELSRVAMDAVQCLSMTVE